MACLCSKNRSVLKKNGSKKRHGIIVVVTLLVISFLFLTANIKFWQTPSFVESIVIAVISPFQELVSKTINGTARVWNNYISLIDTQEENYQLRREIEKLKFQNNTLVEKLNSFERLDKLSDFVNTSCVAPPIETTSYNFPVSIYYYLIVVHLKINYIIKTTM